MILQRYYEPQFTSSAGFLKRKEIREYSDRLIEEYDVRSGQGAQTRARSVSGGNQQKAVFARILMTHPNIFLCDEPTQGVDVKTRAEIHRLLREEANNGCGIIFVSSDLKEVMEIADRIQIISSGRTRELLENNGITSRQVLSCCYAM